MTILPIKMNFINALVAKKPLPKMHFSWFDFFFSNDNCILK